VAVEMIRDIVREWSWASYKAPVVVETGKGLVVIDGQHTAIAAATRGIKFIPILVVDADERRSRTPIPRKPEAKPQPAPSEWIG
jgi:hypothetical protein